MSRSISLLSAILAVAYSRANSGVHDITFSDTDGEFLLYNDKYDKAMLSYKSSCDMFSTTEQKPSGNELWKFEEEPKHPGYYYIFNEAERCRLAKWSKGDEDVTCYHGNYNDDQLWKFTKVTGKTDRYFIENKKHYGSFISKWSNQNCGCGTYKYHGGSDQQWQVVPRFAVEDELWQKCSSFINDGDEPASHTLTITEQVTGTVQNSNDFSYSVKLAYNSPVGVQASFDFSQRISQMVSSTTTRSITTTTSITVPARSKVEVLQLYQIFKSPISEDSFDFVSSEYKSQVTPL